MAVLGNRGTGILDMLIEGFRRSGQNMEQPNMSQVAPTPLQRAMNQPVSRLTSTGDVGTIYPDGRVAQQTSVPLLQNLSRGRVLNPINPMQDMGQPMIVSEELRKEAVAEALNRPEYGQLVEARQAEQQPQATPDVMGMQKLAEDAAKVQKAINDNPQLEEDPTFMDKVKGYFGNRENMAKLALAFNTMRLSPDAGLAAALGSELKDIRATKVVNKRSNATLNALRQAGVPEKDLQVLANDPELLRKYAVEFFKKQLGTLPAEQQAFENLIADMSPEDQEKARRIKAGLDPRAGSQFALGLEELFARAAAQAGGSEAGKSEQEKKALQVQNDKTWQIWQTAISGLEESLGNTATGRIAGLLPAITSNQQIADQAIAIMAPVLKNIFRESGEGVFTDRDQEILIDMIPDRGSNPDTIAYAINAINDIVAAKLNQQIQVEIVPNAPAPNVLRFDAQGNPI